MVTGLLRFGVVRRMGDRTARGGDIPARTGDSIARRDGQGGGDRREKDKTVHVAWLRVGSEKSDPRCWT